MDNRTKEQRDERRVDERILSSLVQNGLRLAVDAQLQLYAIISRRIAYRTTTNSSLRPDGESLRRRRAVETIKLNSIDCCTAS